MPVINVNTTHQGEATENVRLRRIHRAGNVKHYIRGRIIDIGDSSGLTYFIHKFIINYGGHSIFAVLNSVEIYRNRIFLGGR
jgi:hypothetical protein